MWPLQAHQCGASCIAPTSQVQIENQSWWAIEVASLRDTSSSHLIIQFLQALLQHTSRQPLISQSSCLNPIPFSLLGIQGGNHRFLASPLDATPHPHEGGRACSRASQRDIRRSPGQRCRPFFLLHTLHQPTQCPRAALSVEGSRCSTPQRMLLSDCFRQPTRPVGLRINNPQW